MKERPKRVLIVEDVSKVEDADKPSLQKRLEDCGHWASCVLNADDAVKEILNAENPVDLVLIDIESGRQDQGIKTAEIILKQNPLPIAFLLSGSEWDNFFVRETIVNFGCIDKDYSDQALCDSINRILSQIEVQQHIETQRQTFERMCSLAKIGVWRYEPQNQKLVLSKEVYTTLELADATEVSLDDVLQLFSDEASQILLKAINLAIEEEKSFVRDSEIVTTTNKHKWIRIQGEAVPVSGGDGHEIFGTLQDISEIRLLDRVTQESEMTLNQVEQITHIGHWSVNMLNGSFFHSDEIKRIFGYEPSEYALSVEDAINAYHPGDRDEVIRLFNRAVETGEGYEFDLRVVQPNGNVRNVHSKGYTEQNSEGKVVRVYGVFQDITESMQAIEALERSKMLLKSSLESQKDTILLSIDQNYRYLYFNKTHAETMKHIYGKEVQIGMSVLDCITSDKDREVAKTNYDRALAGESHSNIRVYGESSKKAWFESYFNPILNDKNEIIGATAMARDVSERKRAEEALEDSRNRYHALFEQAGDGIIMLNSKGEILSVNDTFAQMHGYTHEEMLKIELSAMDVEGNSKIQERVDRIMAGETLSFEVEHYHKDGHVFPLVVTANLITVGNEQFIIALHRDLSERKRMEQELQKTQRLESLGILAGGIAHDFNNLMSGIFGYIEMANEETDTQKISAYNRRAMMTIDRARALTQQLLTFAKGGTPILEIGHLFPFVQETATFALSGSNVLCRFDIQEKLWTCNFDKNQIGQVIENLVINAQQAMPVGGTIEVSARNVPIEQNSHPLLEKGNYVKIRVKDSGVGIPKEMISKIFDPFFTTKTKGHGLGLATCYSIIHRHGGGIDVASEPGKGSTVDVYLPSSEESVVTVSETVIASHQGKGTFVVMDDEEVIRDVLKSMLENFGYSVVCKERGEEVVDLMTSNSPEGHDIVGMIFDLTVPGGMGGQEAVKGIRKLSGRVPIFVSSGYADDPVMKNPTDYGFTASICKPFRIRELSEILNQHLRG